MATIRTTIQVQDKMSQAFRSMNSAMNTVISSFEHLQSSSSNAVNTAAIQSARQELARAEVAFNDIEQEIREANLQQQQLNNSIRQGTGAASGLLSKLGAVVGTYLSFQAGGNIIQLSDTLTNTTARINLMNDGLRTTEEMQRLIFESAQRTYSSYLDTAAVVSKLGILAGKAFSGNEEIILFTELMNKNFAIGGASIQEQTAAMYQLTQAMAAGKLQGDEFRSIMENAPLLAQAIEEQMRKIDPGGSMKDWAREGMLTADVIKNAMFSAADEINQKFTSMPLTFSQIWTGFRNEAVWAFQGVLQQLNNLANSERFKGFVDGFIQAMYVLASVASSVFNFFAGIGAIIYDNWSMIGPLVMGALGAIVAYNAYLGILRVGTMLVTAAQWAWNFAMTANPIGLVIMAIVLLIGIFYALIGSINQSAGTAISATGAIAGAFAVLGAFIWNTVVGVINAVIQFIWTSFAEPWIGIIEWVLNVFQGGFNSFGDAVANLLGQIISWFLSLGKVVTKIIDAIFGTDWTSGLSSLQSSVTAWGKNDSAITLDRAAPAIKSRIEYSGAWDAGYNWGSNLFDFGSKNNPTDEIMDSFSGIEDMKGAIDDTAGNTKKMAESMDMAEEDLKYLRDLAEQEVINRFTTAEIRVDMANVNHINSEMDLDGVVSYLEEKVYETMTIAAEGDHE